MAERTGEASVGLLVNDGNILLIKRAERKDDPWSGHIALPGGFVKNGETREIAVLREIFEETSISLSEKNIVGRMEAQNPMNRKFVTVYPFILSVDDYDGAAPGPEVESLRVVKVSDLVHRTGYYHGRDAYLAGDWIVWGLTYKILTSYMNGGNSSFAEY